MSRRSGPGDTQSVVEQHANGQGEAWRGRASDHFDAAAQRFFNPWKDTRKIARRRHGVTDHAFRVLDVGETGVFNGESRQS